jgi:hypothetical protein
MLASQRGDGVPLSCQEVRVTSTFVWESLGCHIVALSGSAWGLCEKKRRTTGG